LQGRIWIEWRLVCFAAMFAVGAPGQAVVADIPIPARLVLAALGLLAWWYLFRCLADTWAGRFLRRDGQAAPLTPWLVFVGAFYATGLPLGRAWRDCRVGEVGTNMVHVLVSATAVGLAGVATWAAVRRATDGSRGLIPVCAALIVALALLWPAMAVWHLLAGSAGDACAPDTIPGWWPSWMPIG
jgi:hypothetical protein